MVGEGAAARLARQTQMYGTQLFTTGSTQAHKVSLNVGDFTSCFLKVA
jgi:hypothetical protein